MVCCRQTGDIDAECLQHLKRRVQSLAGPQYWFLQYVRPAGYPEVAPAGYPHPPFTMIGVAKAADAEPLFYDHVRNTQHYMDAYGLLPADLGTNPAIEKNGNGMIAQVTCVRKSRFLWACAPLPPAPLRSHSLASLHRWNLPLLLSPAGPWGPCL